MHPRSGVWRHHSGELYLVLGLARFDDDDDDLVVYVRLYRRDDGGHPMSVRRLSAFTAEVDWPDGTRRPRFVFVGDREPPREPGAEGV